MSLSLLLPAVAAIGMARGAEVLCGIDVLERDGFAALRGRKVALITNHTGRTRDGRFTSDVLASAPGMTLVCLFAPEHGLRGLVDEAVKDGKDEKTGLPAYSLYNPGQGPERYRPKKEQLKGVDTIVFDIQDIGTRFYTYVGTLGYAMEAAARDGLEVFVLDRPNPIRALEPDGPVADTQHLGLTAFHTIPLVHGMTAGELANLFNRERKIGAKVSVVKCEGWLRNQWWDETGLLWVNPSPNMRSQTQAHLYPGIGLVEATNISVGRGTDTPFELVGAPWLDGRKLAAALNAKRLPGVRVIPIEFTPDASKFANERCGGVNFLITDRAAFDPVRFGCELAFELHRLFPAWDTTRLAHLLQNTRTTEVLLQSGYEAARRDWTPALQAFKAIRKTHLLYR